MKRLSLVSIVWAIAAVLLLTACASGPKPPKETKLKSEVVAAENINPNRRGTPQPVKLHVFYLKQDEAFLQANFAELIAPDSEPLAADLLRRTHGLVGPSETQLLDDKFDKQTKFIGVVAEFTNISEAQWRAVAPVPEGSWKDLLTPLKDHKRLINVDELSVTAAVVED